MIKFFKQKFLGSGTIGEKGQVVIPAAARCMQNIKSGDRVIFFGNEKILHIIKADEMEELLDEMTELFNVEISAMTKEIKEKAKKLEEK